MFFRKFYHLKQTNYFLSPIFFHSKGILIFLLTEVYFDCPLPQISNISINFREARKDFISFFLHYFKKQIA
jgi:hypothetical protein